MSELAEQISEAIDATTNHAEVIDRIIAENAELSCSYCNEVTFKGMVVESGLWTSVARFAMAEHVLTCSKRPEAQLVDLLMKIKQVADLGSAKEFGDAEERLATIAQMIKGHEDGKRRLSSVE